MLLVWMLPTFKFLSKRWCRGKGGKGGEIWLQASGCPLWLCTSPWGGVGAAAPRDFSDWYHELCMHWRPSCLALLIFSLCPVLTGEAETTKSVPSAGFRSAGSFLGGRDPPLGTHSHGPQFCLNIARVRARVQVHTECFESRINL